MKESKNENMNKSDNFCNTAGASNMVKEQITNEVSKSYSLNNSNYSQFCFNRLPCGICMRTNQMCPFAGNSNVEITPTCEPLQTPVNSITNPQVWYKSSTDLNSINSIPNNKKEEKN